MATLARSVSASAAGIALVDKPATTFTESVVGQKLTVSSGFFGNSWSVHTDSFRHRSNPRSSSRSSSRVSSALASTAPSARHLQLAPAEVFGPNQPNALNQFGSPRPRYALEGNLKGNLLQSRPLTIIPKRKVENNGRLEKRNCRASLLDDVPFALAIGASILSTLLLPVDREQEGNDENSYFGPDDVQSGAMQIISFIPLFNWLVWVFAWLDTRQPRYLAFSVIYLAPYLKTGLSLTPEDSWLPIASILACIVHVQLDISVGVEGAQPLGDVSKVFLERTSQMKDLGFRADGLVNRLKELANNSDAKPMETVIQEDDQRKDADWKTIQEDALKKEFAEWDAKLSSSKTVEESVSETDS